MESSRKIKSEGLPSVILPRSFSLTYFGFQWRGWFFTTNIIPFGYLPSFFTLQVYLFPTIFVPSASHAPCTLMTTTPRKIRLPYDSSLYLGPEELNITSSHIASFIVCYTLVKLRYCIGLQKSIFQSFQSVPFLVLSATPVCRIFVLQSHARKRSLLLSSKVSLIMSSMFLCWIYSNYLGNVCLCLWR